MNLTAKQFDLVNARACARASADAYRQSTLDAASTDTHCLIGEAPDCFIVAFRGTASIRNWITDADFKRVFLCNSSADMAEVHAGFLKALDSIIGEITHRLGGSSTFVTQNCKPLFLTGHSLGGALAVLAAYALHRAGFQIAQVITFGQPRVGNGEFKRLYEAALGDRTFRVVYEEDIVARVPHLPAVHDPYRHVATEIFLPAFGIGKIVVDPPLLFLLGSDAWGIYRAWCVSKFAAALDPIEDHHVNLYVQALRNVPDSQPSTLNPQPPQ